MAIFNSYVKLPEGKLPVTSGFPHLFDQTKIPFIAAYIRLLDG